jgi:parallel beta-helix repeat protein
VVIGAALAAMIVGVSAVASGAAGRSDVIDVQPGKNAIAHAIASASRGDVLRIHQGIYHEALTIDKPLTLEPAPGDHPVVDADCKANDTIHVTSGGVEINGLTVTGAATGSGDYPAEIFFEGTPSGKAADNRLIDSCDAQYGISAFDTGAVSVEGNSARGFDDSGIYIGSISSTHGAHLTVTQNKTNHNARGIIVEDSNAPAVHIDIEKNEMRNNTLANDEGLPSDGLYLTNSDHVRVLRNEADDNGGSGFHPNSSSDHNVFISNTARHNGVRGLLNEGHDNCGSNNSFALPSC